MPPAGGARFGVCNAADFGFGADPWLMMYHPPAAKSRRPAAAKAGRREDLILVAKPRAAELGPDGASVTGHPPKV